LQQIVDHHHLVADGHARIPERIEHRVDQRLDLARAAARHEQHVEVALPTEQAATVAAHGEQAHGSARSRALLSALKERKQQVVRERGVLTRERETGRVALFEQRVQRFAALQVRPYGVGE
jgi:G3E family GTPase